MMALISNQRQTVHRGEVIGKSGKSETDKQTEWRTGRKMTIQESNKNADRRTDRKNKESLQYHTITIL